MNQQLQTRESDLAECMTTRSLDRVAIANASRGKIATENTQGQQFAAALKAKYDGSRPIIEDVIFATMELGDLKAGKSWLEISHYSHPGIDKPYYATTITNRSTQRIRIDRFGTYIQKGKTLVLHSLTGGFLSAQQFQERYELGASEWLEPGQVVIDPNNHSNLGVYWVYSGTTASGQKLVAGAAWNGKPWWKMF
jgi:hypothetical protein